MTKDKFKVDTKNITTCFNDEFKANYVCECPFLRKALFQYD